MFSLESPRGGDSNVCTQYTIFIIKPKITPDYSKSAAFGFFSYRPKNEFETAAVNEPSVFEPLRFYRTCVNRPVNTYCGHYYSTLSSLGVY